MLELENKYIDLLLKRCLNLTKSTSLFISYDKTCDDFVKKLVLRAKELGYSDIYEDCSDIFYLKNKLMNSSLDEIENDPYYDKSIWDKYAEKKANFLMLDTEFPTIDWKHPYELTPGELDVMERLETAFRNCEKLQNHMRLLLDKGGLYKIYNGNLLFHGCIPLNEDGSLKEIQIYGKTYKGRELYDVLEAYVRRAFYAVDREEQRKGRDILWFIWASPSSPLFGKDKMTTFERYFIADKETHKETKGAYYHLLENEKVVDGMIREFGLDPETGHIINGHVPVHQGDGESPVKCNGKVIVIDGGFCKAYQKVTGIAGYTLIYNSYGLVLTAHEPFTSKEQAISKESDIVSNRVSVHYTSKRRLVGDTDTGRALKERIGELRQLLDAYRKGIIKEKK